MVGWRHRLNAHESELTPRDHEGQGSLGCCSPWGHKESDTTEQPNNNSNNTDKNTIPEEKKKRLLKNNSINNKHINK